MKKIIKLNKKFISFFLAVMMIYSMVFSGIKVSAATTDANNGDWSAENITLTNTSEAQLMVRVGDIDNFGFGWPSSFDPFSGNETPSHSLPFYPTSNDPDGTDRIMVVSGYNYNGSYKTTCVNRDGYTQTTSRSDQNIYKYYDNQSKTYKYTTSTNYYGETLYSTDNDNNVRPINIAYNLGNISVQNATIQMFVDDFQPGTAHGITQGNVKYAATINGVEVPELSNVINNLDQSGPIGKLITFQIPQRYLDLVRTGQISIKIDDTTTGSTGDGYAIDFVKLLINRTGFTNTATISGNVKDINNNNIAGATVSAGGVVTATTDANGNYVLNNVPAGQVIVTASKTGYNTSTQTIPTVIAGYGYTANFTLTPSTPPTIPIIRATPTTPTNTKVTATISYSADSTIQQYRIDIGGNTGEWKVYTGAFDVTQNCIIEAQGINQYGNASQIASYTVNNIDTTPPTLTLSQSPTTSTNGTVTITATATDNVAVASITKPDNTVATGSSTTYPVSANGTYTFTATDTAGNVTTQSINISNIVISSTNDTSLPNISASLESVTPNPAKSSDEINVKYAINTVPFSLSSGMIDEAEVLVDMSQGMKNNQRFSEVQNGFVNQVINDSNLSGIKLGVVGYNDSVYVGTRSNYSDPKTCLMQQTDENLSGIDKTKFLPLYNLNDANTKDGYRQFYQNGYINNDISNDDQRQFGSALKVADNVLTNYGTSGAKKAIIIISSGNLTYSDDQINSIIGKGYKIIVLDISNSDNTNIKNTYLKLCGNDFGINGNYYKGTFNDQANYNSVDADMKNVDASLKGVTGVTTLSINDAKLNIDLGENFQAVDGGGLVGSGKVCTVTIPQINFTYNSATGLWQQSGSIEVNFKVKPESGKYGQLGFGLYTNTDNTTKTNSSTISYTNFYNIATSKIIETPTINITMDVPAPVITSPTDGTSTSNNKPTISGTGQAGDTVTVYDGTTVIGTATVDSNGNWSLTPATVLVDGKHVITATQEDAAGNESGVSNTVNLTIVLSAPVITSPTDGTSTSNNKPTISGTGQAGDTVTVYDGTTVIGTATVDSNGNWSLTPATVLVDGKHVITATQEDAAGNESGVSNTVNLTIVLSAPVITSPTDGTSTSNNKPTISGTGQAGDTVTVYDGTTVIGTATVDSNGNWSMIVGTALADGNHVITAIQADAAGNASGASNTVNLKIVPSAPVITSPTDGTSTSNNKPTISGTGQAGDTVTVYDGTTVIGTATVDSTGNWSLTPATALADGKNVLTATQADAAGNVSGVSNTVNITIVPAPSTILAHGLYNGSGTGISNDNPLAVTNSIPVTMAMEVDVESSHPAINWSWNCSDNSGSKIIDDNIVFNKYEISDDGTLGTVETTTLNNSGNINITGLTMEKGKKYIIVYTITPMGGGQVTVTAKADTTSSVPVTLNIGARPDLF
jgi:predicted hotdog family 3-hydroxylacyl-ACP dehydratase